MKYCLNLNALLVAGLLAASATVAAAQSTPQNSAAPTYVVTATGQKIPLSAPVERKSGTVTYLSGPTIIDNRVDSNAILNLDAHPLAATKPAAAAPAAASKKVEEAAKPAARDLTAELKSAKARYAQANIDLKAAQKANDQKATVAARHDVAVAKSDIDRLNAELAKAKPTRPTSAK